MKVFKLMLLGTTLMSSSYANEHTSMDELLDTFRKNSDLSKKTRLENAGNVTIITREELDRRQARNLRDVMRSLPLLDYVENRWAIPDPIYVAHTMPFNSNSVRIYINDREVSTASYGSGLFHLGNIDLGFVDHIEIYTLSPSFEYSTESTRHLIKLYSKISDRDKGSELKVSAGSLGFNQESYQYANTIDGISYFGYMSRMDDKREKHKSFDRPLSRDQERYFFFSTISSKNQHFQIQAIKNNKDMFMGISTDGRTQKATNNTDYLQIGYENNAIDNLKLSFTFEKGKSVNHFKNDFEALELTNSDQIFTADAQYKWHNSDKNELIFGSKFRYKHFNVDKNIYNGYAFEKADYDTQTISSLYMEDNYALNTNWLLSMGVQFSHTYNNSIVEDQDTWTGRMGIIYSDEAWVAKTFLYHSEFLIEPYLYNTTGTTTVQDSIKPEKLNNITQEIEYKGGNYTLNYVLGYSHIKNATINKSEGSIINKDDPESIFFTYVEYRYKFDIYNTLYSSLSYSYKKNLYRGKQTNKDDEYKTIRELGNGLHEYKAVLRLSNHYEKFDIFNELIYNYNSVFKKHYLDYSAGVKYHYSDKIKFSLKGENILDQAREDYFERGRINSESNDWDYLKPLYVSPIDQKIYFTVEYLF